MILLSNVFVHPVKTGMEISVSIATEDKFGAQMSILASVQLNKSGTDTHVMILAVEEESLIPPADNVFAHLETGMEPHV
jgi:hypothetical protein